MVSTQTLLPFISILFLVLVELSGRVDNDGLYELARKREGRVLGLFPDLGFLTIVHCVNVFLIMVGYLIVFLEFIATDDIVVTLIYFAMLVFLFVIPYIEVEQYDLIIESTGSRKSRNTHVFMVLLIIAEPLIFISLGLLPGDYGDNIGAALFTLTYLLGTLLFLKYLKQELQMMKA